VIPIGSGVKAWIVTGRTDLRRGMDWLALQVQDAFKRDPHGGDLYVLRGKRGRLIKILWRDGLGLPNGAGQHCRFQPWTRNLSPEN
jgi:transposase